MLSLFPQIMFLAPAGTTLLRVAAAICFVYMARYYWQERTNLSGLDMPIVGHLRSWMIDIGVVIIGITAILIFVGAWTQAAAIVAAAMALKHIIFYRKYRNIYPFELSTFWLLFCISLMLIVTGAGAFSLSVLGATFPTAVDLPL